MSEAGPELDLSAAWPPGPEESQLLDELATLVARAGAARFLDVRVVAADAHDFPEPWTPTRGALERLLARLFWHVYVDVDVVVEDHRIGFRGDGWRLQTSVIEWLALHDGTAVFHLEHFGNDDVAGLLSHEIGRAFLAWSATSDPYREVQRETTDRQGTIAAIYLGLGVLATNSATLRRGHSNVTGAWEYKITTRGGLSTYAATYVLAVQAVARGRVDAAIETLHERPRAAFHRLVDYLRPHRADLLVRLGLDLDEARPTLERDDAPPAVTDAERPEPHLHAINVGKPVFRVPGNRLGPGGFLGMLSGTAAVVAITFAGVAIMPIVWIGALAGTTLAGCLVGRKSLFYECATCGIRIPDGASTCPGCAGTVRGTVKHRDERLEREDELENQ